MDNIKIIFLDIDGVLVTRHSICRPLTKDHYHRFQKSCVKELNRIVRRTEAKIVVSSTWRKHDWDEVLQHLADEGIVADVIGKTPSLNSGIRGREIGVWLSTYKMSISSFVILDDDSDMEDLMPRLVQTSMKGGLRRCHSDMAIQLLNEGRRQT